MRCERAARHNFGRGWAEAGAITANLGEEPFAERVRVVEQVDGSKRGDALLRRLLALLVGCAHGALELPLLLVNACRRSQRKSVEESAAEVLAADASEIRCSSDGPARFIVPSLPSESRSDLTLLSALSASSSSSSSAAASSCAPG